MHTVEGWFGLHLSLVQISIAVLVMVVIFHFLILSKDFRTFVVLGLFGFAGSLGKMLGVLVGKSFLGILRGIKVFFAFQVFSVQEIARAIREEREGFDRLDNPS